MPGSATAKRYAQAAFDLAEQRGQLDQWAADLQVITTALQDEEFRLFLDHAKVPLARKVRTLQEAFQGTEPMVQNLVSLLVSRNLVELAPQVETWYQHLLNQHRGRQDVEVWSAVELEEPERQRVSQFVTRLIEKEVVLHTQVDPEILGGLVIRIGDRLIDGSTRSRLAGLGKQLQRDSVGAGV